MRSKGRRLPSLRRFENWLSYMYRMWDDRTEFRQERLEGTA